MVLCAVVIALTSGVAPASAAPVDYAGVADLAHTQYELGKPYVYGAAGPNAFDNSGLVKWCYAQFGVQVPRTAASQYSFSRAIPLEQRQKGDLVFIGTSAVGIFFDDGDMVIALVDTMKVSLVTIPGNATFRTLRP
jgi:cell wall-associated NlpC family hydrolase